MIFRIPIRNGVSQCIKLGRSMTKSGQLACMYSGFFKYQGETSYPYLTQYKQSQNKWINIQPLYRFSVPVKLGLLSVGLYVTTTRYCPSLTASQSAVLCLTSVLHFLNSSLCLSTVSFNLVNT